MADSLQFSTAGLNEADARELWNSFMTGGSDMHLAGPAPFASYKIWHTGIKIAVSEVSAGSTFRRSKRQIAQSHAEHYRFIYRTAGGMKVRIDDSDLEVGAGDILLFDSGQERQGIEGEGESLSLMIPKERLHALVPAAGRQLHGAHWRAGTVMGDLLGAHIAALRNGLDDLTGDSVPLIMQSTSTLLAGAVAHLDMTATKAASLFPLATLARIKDFITEHLADPELGPAMVMKRFQLSQATLYNIFSQSSATVSDFIWQQRLRRCFDDLTDPGQAHRRISDIAYSWGFNNNAHFSRAFRQAFSCSPSEARGLPWGLQGDQAANENFAFPEMLAVASAINNRIRGLRGGGPERRS